FHIEITALRHAAWFRLLTEKLGAIAGLAGCSAEMKYGRETPERVSESAYRSILSSVRSEVLDTDGIGKRTRLEQRFRDFGFWIVWEKSANTQFNFSSYDLHPSSQYGAKLVFNAVRKKARQLPHDVPGCVLLDVGDDEPHDVQAFMSRLGG